MLASRHPEVQFFGVDFMPSLAEVNTEFHRDSLKFVSGYALEPLERDAIGTDRVVFSATAIAIRNAVATIFASCPSARAASCSTSCFTLSQGGLMLTPTLIKNRAFRPAWTSQFVVHVVGRRP